MPLAGVEDEPLSMVEDIFSMQFNAVLKLSAAGLGNLAQMSPSPSTHAGPNSRNLPAFTRRRVSASVSPNLARAEAEADGDSRMLGVQA